MFMKFVNFFFFEERLFEKAFDELARRIYNV